MNCEDVKMLYGKYKGKRLGGILAEDPRLPGLPFRP